MYGIKLYNHVPAPKPAHSDRIVAAHYYPAWKAGATDLHHGFEDLFDFPERTPLCGYYESDDPLYMNFEIKWALEHGINCFIYCWYRKKENEGKPVTLSDLRLGESLHSGFLRADFAALMHFAIMYEAQNNWGGTNAADLCGHLLPFWIENYFSRPNYLKIDGCPVLFIYDYQNQIRDAFSDAVAQKKAFDACREACRRAGFGGLKIALEYRGTDEKAISDARKRGYDFAFAYCWPYRGEKRPADEAVIQEQMRLMETRSRQAPDFFCPTASVMWDPSPRFRSMPKVYTPENNPSLWQLSPESYRELLVRVRQLSNRFPAGSIGRRMVMLDNFNEWDEGHYLLPSLGDGFAYLEAVREALSDRDNLPDYRLPDALGFGPFDRNWKTPDSRKKE